MRRTTIILLATLILVIGAGVAVLGGPSRVLPGWLTGSDSVDASGGPGVLEGWVQKVDAEERVVQVTRGLLPLSPTHVSIGEDTDIRVHDKIGSIENLREGVHVKICYDVRVDGPPWRAARTIDVPPSAGPCRAVTAQPLTPRPSAGPVAAAPLPPAVVEPSAPEAADTKADPGNVPAPMNAKPAPRKPRKPPAVAEAARSRPAVPRTSAAAPRASSPQPAAAPRAVPAPQPEIVTPRAAITPVVPPSARRDTGDDGHDYDAVIDRVLRR